MKRAIILAMTGLGLGSAISGCRDTTPPPPRVPVPSADNRQARMEYDAPRPLEVPPPDARDSRVYADEPLIAQPPPEQRAFIDAYNHVGRPKITLFVNRTMEGDIIPVQPNTPEVTIEKTRRSNTGVTVDQRDVWSDTHRYDVNDRFESKGPAEFHEKTEIHRGTPSQYDEINAKSLDYEAVENIMTDWLAANGQTTIIAPTMARQRLTDEQVKDLQSGRPVALSEIAQRLGADILVQVQARPSRQVEYVVRMVGEAINTRGGQSIGRAVVDVPPPLDKYRINQYTRFLARKLMDDMTSSWGAMAVADMKAPIVPNPVPPPVVPAPDKPAPVPTPIPPPDKPAPAPDKPAPVPSPQPPTTQEHPLPQPQPPLPPVPPDVPPTTQPR